MKNQKSKIKNQKIEVGFTLIEILVSVSLIGIFMIAISQVFLGVIKSQSKSEVTKDVKQNGDYAFSVIDGMIRNAKSTNACPYSGNSLSIVNPDNNTTVFACTGTQIASNSSYLTSTNVSVVPSSCTFIVNCPPNSPQYVYFSFTVTQPGVGGGVADNAMQTYQGTVSLRSY